MMSSGHKVGEILDLNLTYEDYCALPEDGRRYQLIEGQLDVALAPSYTHQRVLRNLGSILHAHVRGQHLGVIL